MRIYPGVTIDYEVKQLNTLGYTGSLNDMQFQYLRDQGLNNALPDMFGSFTGPDVLAPTIVSTLPADNATGVADTVSPFIEFNENVFTGTGLITLRQNNAGWSDLETFDVATEIGTGPGQVYFAGTGITINPTSSLVAGREYAIRIASTAVQDGSGNFFAGVANDTTISFTVAAGDLIAPTIVSTNPVDGATGVAVASNLTITFSENVVFGTGLITLRENISGTWSDLETFDVVTEVGTGDGQVSISGAVLTINPTTSLSASREYAIRIAPTAIRDAAANAFAGIADDTTFSFTSAPGVTPFTARFGDSANNAAGTGNFDTNLYTASPPANGTYGNFTVTAGVISCNGSQTVGTYDVGGYPVQVVAGLKAVANQAQHNALSNTTDINKTILVREGAAIDWNNTSSGFGRRIAFGSSFVILGDGPPVTADPFNAALDSRRHYNRHFLAACTGLTCDNLRIVTPVRQDVITSTAASGGSISATGNWEYRNCLIVASRPDPNGDYTAGAGAFPGSIAYFGNAQVVGTRLYNNVAIGGRRNFRVNGRGYVELIGNVSYLSYEDGFQLTVDTCPTLVGGNLMGIGLARPSDSGNPHGDGLQILPGATHENHLVEACAMFAGNHRGRTFNQSYFLSNSTVGYVSLLRDLILVDDPIYSFTLENTRGSTIEHCQYVNTPYTALPNPPNGIRFGSSPPVSGSNFLTNVISTTGGTVDPSVTQSGNVTVAGYVASDWVAMYENWTVDSEQYPTLQKIMADLRTKTTGPGNGKGHRVTFSGSKNSDYVIAGGLTAPTLTSLVMTSTAALSAAATITTNTVLNPIFFAVVPVGTAVATPRDIKHRKLTGALVYGFTSTKNGDTVIPLNLAGTLVAGTQYDVVAMQENGWTAVSTVSRITFTAT